MKATSRLFVVTALFAVGLACWSGFGSAAQEKAKEERGVSWVDPGRSGSTRSRFLETTIRRPKRNSTSWATREMGTRLQTPSSVSAPFTQEMAVAKSARRVRLIFKRLQKK